MQKKSVLSSKLKTVQIIWVKRSFDYFCQISTLSLFLVSRLQLLRALLDKYPTSLPEDQLLPLVSTLQQLQTETKRYIWKKIIVKSQNMLRSDWNLYVFVFLHYFISTTGDPFPEPRYRPGFCRHCRHWSHARVSAGICPLEWERHCTQNGQKFGHVSLGKDLAKFRTTFRLESLSHFTIYSKVLIVNLCQVGHL